MSNTTHIHGTINITPDFEMLGSAPMFESVKLEHRLVRDSYDLFAPVKTVIGALVAEAPDWVDEDMVINDLTAIIAALPEDTKFNGYFEARSVDYGDMWRVYIVDRKPVIVTPEIVWPSLDAAA